ncbi:hypothetical protein ACFXEL_21690 [Streptomyces sp. NPDC059382]|uniref:hypothetical protein n=1 Tax=Streptomyces sp. NPDC059382 TaxID=3346816 RepID=UPI0036B197E4
MHHLFRPGMAGPGGGHQVLVKSGKYRGGRYGDSLRPWSRALLVLGAVLAVLFCARALDRGHDATAAYGRAFVCGGEECLHEETGEVRDRRTGQTCTSNGTSGGTTTGGAPATIGGVAAGAGGVGGAPVTIGGGGGNAGTSCTRYHDVKLAWSGGSDWLGVAAETYEEVRAGDRARLRTWQGQVVRLEIGGLVRTYPPASQTGLWSRVLLLWLGLGVAVWALVSGRRSDLYGLAVPWCMVAFPTTLFGPALLMWSPPAFCGALALLTAGLAFGARAGHRF